MSAAACPLEAHTAGTCCPDGADPLACPIDGPAVRRTFRVEGTRLTASRARLSRFMTALMLGALMLAAIGSVALLASRLQQIDHRIAMAERVG